MKVYFLVLLVLVSCGVKGPPLPPLPDTPEESEISNDDSGAVSEDASNKKPTKKGP